MRTRFLWSLGFLLITFTPDLRAAEGIYLFKDLQGPAGKSVLSNEVPTPWQAYHQPAPGRLAILLTDTTSAWLGVAHGLKTIGVPFFITQDYREALKSRVVFVYPVISGRVLSSEALHALADYPNKGNTLIGGQVLGARFDAVFGFEDAVPSSQHLVMTLDPQRAASFSLADPKELVLQLGDAKTGGEDRMGSYGYTGSTAPLAAYEDGSAAITQRTIGKGRAYAFGIDVGALVLKAYGDRDQWMERSYVNGFEPAIDVFLRIIKGMYVEGEPNAVTLAGVPDNKALAVLLTHDIDFTASVGNALTYARYEHDEGIQATYFVQTKYVRDDSDDIFWNEENLPKLKTLASLGMELGSHSVAHSPVFNKFDLGTGGEIYPVYRPFVRNRKITEGGTVFGELRVSKFLIDHAIADRHVVSFRPGHLRNPYVLPQALAATGYRWSSSCTANNSLTHLPFQLNYSRGQTSELPIFEFPVTLEDEEGPSLLERLPKALALANQIAAYGGLYVILIHPNIVGQKFEFEKQFVQAVKPTSWFGTLDTLGRWWAARNQVEIAPADKTSSPVVRVTVPERIDGLTMRIPKRWTFQKSDPAALTITQAGESLTILSIKGEATLYFRSN